MISNDGGTHFVIGLLFATCKMCLKDVRQQGRFACLFLVSPLAPGEAGRQYQSACVQEGPSEVTRPRARATDEDTTATEREGIAGKTQEVSSRSSSLPRCAREPQWSQAWPVSMGGHATAPTSHLSPVGLARLCSSRG